MHKLICLLAAFSQLNLMLEVSSSSLAISSGRIVGGSEATKGQFPFQAGILATSSDGESVWCGGSLIAPDWVLTAAKCLTGKTQFQINLGSVNFHSVSDPERVVIDATESFAHPDFDAIHVTNDIGLIKLPSAAPLSDMISTIALPSLSDANDSFENAKATLSGWGATSYNGPMSDVLQWMEGTVISNEECIKYLTILDSSVCIVDETSTSAGCNGDGGGPLTVDYNGGKLLIGVQSKLVYGCPASGIPNGLTRVTSFLEWIGEVTGIQISP